MLEAGGEVKVTEYKDGESPGKSTNYQTQLERQILPLPNVSKN